MFKRFKGIICAFKGHSHKHLKAAEFADAFIFRCERCNRWQSKVK